VKNEANFFICNIEALLLAITAGVALAATVSCFDDPLFECSGTSDNDTIFGTNDRDDIEALEGGDVVFALDDPDTVAGSSGRDDIYGGNGADLLSGGKSPDKITGDSGRDQLKGAADGEADVVIDCGEGTGDKAFVDDQPDTNVVNCETATPVTVDAPPLKWTEITGGKNMRQNTGVR
jgi:hypothetical protein